MEIIQLIIIGKTVSVTLTDIILFITFAIIAWYSWETREMRKEIVNQTKVQAAYQCDALFMEIEKILISDPHLYEFYEIGEKYERDFWSGLSEDQKKMYVFCEMNYFHFAYVYREFLAHRVPESYWKVYEYWVSKLIKYSDLFNKVHDYSKEGFGPEFVKKVSELKHRITRSQ